MILKLDLMMVKNLSKLYKEIPYSFIVKEDTDKFKKGDILKQWFNVPAQNDWLEVMYLLVTIILTGLVHCIWIVKKD